MLDALFAPSCDVPEPSLPGISSGQRPLRSRTFPLAPFQEEGVRRVEYLLRDRGGAILADAVGLGKTYMAVAVIEEHLAQGCDVLVLVPASLRSTWTPLLKRLPASPTPTGRRPGEWRLISHTQLSRGAAGAAADRPRLVVVDEAHRFRNPATLRHASLARLLSDPAASHDGTQLLLITATPVNNGAGDLYNLIRLFLPDDGLADAGVPSLGAAFAAAPDAWRPWGLPAGGERAASRDQDLVSVRTVVRELVVRRTRRLVRVRFGQNAFGLSVGFPHRAAPRLVHYPDPGLEATVRAIERLKLEAYGVSAAALFRLSLLKRLDSSNHAFALSVQRLEMGLELFVEAAAAGRLLRPGTHRVFGDGDPLQGVILDVLTAEATPDVDLGVLRASAQHDLGIVRGLLGDRSVRGSKVRALESLLRRLQPQKVVVFTEFRDTAEHLWRTLSRGFRVGRVDGSGAWLGRHPAGRASVVGRFAPASNGLRALPDRERVDVLIATDVLAEGLNLQDASHVVSYDLPWNPVRLLQRIGRLDRLGSRHDEVVPHLFVPAEGLDAVLGLTRRLQTKLETIRVTVGGDQADTLLTGLARGRAAQVHRVVRSADRELDEPWEQLRTLWLRHLSVTGPTREADALDPSPLSRPDQPLAAGPGARPGIPWLATMQTTESPASKAVGLVLAMARGRPRLLVIGHDGRVASPDRQSVELIRAALAQRTGSSRGGGPDPRTVIRHALDHLESEQAAALAPVRLAASDATARLARRLRHRLAENGSGLDSSTVREAERVLQMLERPAPPALQSALTSLLRWDATEKPGARQLVRRAAAFLQPLPANPDRSSRQPSKPGLPAPEPTGPDPAQPITFAALLLVRGGRHPALQRYAEDARSHPRDPAIPALRPRGSDPVDDGWSRNYLLPSVIPA